MMENINRLINEQVKDKLISYEIAEGLDDIRYRFSYSQGDGIALYGHITGYLFEDNHTFFQNLFKSDIKYIYSLKNYAINHDIFPEKDILNFSAIIKVTKSRDFHMYNHYNTMLVQDKDLDMEDLRWLVEKVVDHISKRSDWQLALTEIFNDQEYLQEMIEEVNNTIMYYVNEEDMEYEIAKREGIFDQIYNHYLSMDLIVNREDIRKFVKYKLKRISKDLEKDIYNLIEEYDENNDVA